MNEQAHAYSARYTSEENALLKEISEYTHHYHPDPGMLSGHVQGQFLQMVSYMVRPHNVLEIGTLSGYSALCLSAGLADGGHLHTIELREKDAMVAREFIGKAGYSDKITVHTGDALEIIEKLKQPWDLVFIDADKINYVNYYEAVVPELRSGGFILADNVLFHGQVLEDEVKGKNAKAIQLFNDHIKNDHRIESVLLTLRDGLMLIRKK
ncbi:MAG TPA: O-methyltransferase [Chitinophagaceae bacterium]|nr:O-methyltransferase [Chitinophagaceae bacterium]